MPLVNFPRQNNRSSHIPLTPVRSGAGVEYIPNRGLSTLYRENRNLFSSLSSFREYTIREFEEFAPATIAHIHYDDESLWWVICAYNGIVFPTRDLYAGRIIRLPLLSDMETALSASINNGTRERFVRI